MLVFLHTFLRNYPMCWCHSLILRHESKTRIFTTHHLLCFLLIALSFFAYLVILTLDKTLLTFWLSLTYLFHVHYQSLKLKQDSWFYSHPGHCSPGGISKQLCWHLPQVFACYLLLIIISLGLLQRSHHDWICFFSEKADRWGKDLASLWGNFNICPQLHWLELPCHSQVELSSISILKVWGDTKTLLWYGLFTGPSWGHHAW